MLRAERYRAEQSQEWDELVKRSKNGTFLFERGYMDYHADRFPDRSLVFYDGATAIAALPLSERDGKVASHGGLTYGGVICDADMTAALMLEVFAVMQQALAADGVTQLVYKPVPHIYHRLPAEEDLYALFRAGAKLVRRDLAAVLAPKTPGPLATQRKRKLGKLRQSALDVRKSDDLGQYMAVLGELLEQKYSATPVHTVAEIELLAARFPDNIKLYAAYDNSEMLAGVLMYETERVAKAQYIATSQRGRDEFALDAVFQQLFSTIYIDKPLIDLGTSMASAGRYLNDGVAAHKESWGARSVVYDWYELDVTQSWDVAPQRL